ncbi:MAG: hypothetical protein IJD60_03190 [Clostridia bacterium]|nr:hypothetical protein [Clostridia bacterium]
MAQRRRQEYQRQLQQKRRQHIITALCIAGGVGAVVLSLIICILVFDPFHAAQEFTTPVSSPLPYSAADPFSIRDLTASQIQTIRKDGSMHVSDGPRGVSIGDSLEKLLERYPSTITETISSGETTGLYAEEEIILYCAEYFENQNGRMTVLPPRGLLTVDNGEIVVTLLAPTSAYPAGTRDSYGSYEHVYAVFTIDPETMIIDSIVLGIDK